MSRGYGRVERIILVMTMAMVRAVYRAADETRKVAVRGKKMGFEYY